MQVVRLIVVLYLLLLGAYSENKVIQSFFHLVIMWVVNLVEFFICDLGVEVMFQNIIQLSMLVFEPVMIFLPTPISIIFSQFIGNKVFSFIS